MLAKTELELLGEWTRGLGGTRVEGLESKPPNGAVRRTREASS